MNINSFTSPNLVPDISRIEGANVPKGVIPEHKCERDLWAQAEGKIISEIYHHLQNEVEQIIRRFIFNLLIF